MASLSSTTSISPSTGGLLTEWVVDRGPVDTAVFNTIGNVKKLDGPLPPPLVSLVVDYLEMRGQYFGEREWAVHFGSVPPAPALSLDENIFQPFLETNPTSLIDINFTNINLVCDCLSAWIQYDYLKNIDQLDNRVYGYGCWEYDFTNCTLNK